LGRERFVFFVIEGNGVWRHTGRTTLSHRDFAAQATSRILREFEEEKSLLVAAVSNVPNVIG
jgi:hypothetical protein